MQELVFSISHFGFLITHTNAPRYIFIVLKFNNVGMDCVIPLWINVQFVKMSFKEIEKHLVRSSYRHNVTLTAYTDC